jgi:SAM-dependent methyltransferase
VDGYGPETYGDAIADLYDDWTADRGVHGPGPTEAAARFLAGLAEGGTALELGIGTGRVALPLAGYGVAVQGVDASERMLAQLRAKPGGADLPVTLGDFADVGVPGTFDLVYVVASTLYALPQQETQLRCLGNAAAHLNPGGRLVVEAFVPDVGRFDRGQRLEVREVGAAHVRLDATRHDPVAQTLSSQQLVVTATGTRLVPAYLRYVWPSELDLMCRLAGLRLAERLGGWDRRPYTGSGLHVSVYSPAPG